MKESKFLKEAIFVLIFAAPWIIYLYLQPYLPELVPSHYTLDGEGNWIVDGRMSPLNFITGMFIPSLLAYISITLPVYLLKDHEKWAGQLSLYGGILYFFKLVLVLFLNAVPAYTLLAAAGRLPSSTAGMMGYTGMLFVLIIINLFIYLLFNRMHKSKQPPLHGPYYKIIWIGTHVVTSIGPLLSLMAIKGLQAGRLVPQFVLLFLTICGNLLYNAKPNLFIGIRTPWTLRNEEVWRKTHRVGGVCCFFLGLTGFIISIAAPDAWLSYIVTTVALTVAIISVVYSFVIYQKVTR